MYFQQRYTVKLKLMTILVRYFVSATHIRSHFLLENDISVVNVM